MARFFYEFEEFIKLRDIDKIAQRLKGKKRT